jgi:pyochelin synthetase
MNDLAILMDELTRVGVQLSLDGAQLAVRAPRGAMTAALKERLAEQKAAIVALLEARQTSGPVAEIPAVVPDPDHRHDPFPLTDIQQAYWIGRTGAFAGGNVSIHGYMEVDCVRLDLGRMAAAWRQLVDRHDMLRAIVRSDGEQQILATVPPYEPAVADLRGRPRQEVDEALLATRERMSHHLAPADRWPTFEIAASLLDGARTRLHISIDLLHIDGASVMILLNEWVDTYARPGAARPALTLSYRDYALAERALQKSEGDRRAMAYWRQRIVDLPPAPDLPLARDPAAISTPRFRRLDGTLSAEEWAAFKENASRAGLTPSTALLACYAEALAGWSRSPAFTINVTLFNRLPVHPQIEEIVGDFTSMVLLGVDCGTDATFRERAQGLQKQLWSDLDHRQVSGIRVLRELARMNRRPSAIMPFVFSSFLNLAPTMRPPRSAFREIGELTCLVSQTPQVWLDHQIFEGDGQLIYSWDFVDDLFPAGMVDAMFEAYHRLLLELAGSDRWDEVRRTSPPAAQLARREQMNATSAPLPGGSLHALFEAHAARRPDWPAVLAGGRALSYGELDLEANRVARALQALEVRPRSLVAVAMEKGWEQIAAVFGILKAGAAYLPIDIAAPAQRIELMLDDGGASVVLTQRRFMDRDWPASVRVVAVDDPALRATKAAPVRTSSSSDDLAYVLYTSGSTGTPKGVMIEHGAVVNRMTDVARRFELAPSDRAIAVTALHHDLSVFDIFGMLSVVGGTIVMPDADATRDPARWTRLAADHGVTVWNSVPAFMAMFVDYLEGARDRAPSALRRVILSGDFIPVNLVGRLRSLFPGVAVVSAGGPTETTVWDICYPIGRIDPGWERIPYGRPMVNAEYHILDVHMEPRPDWAVGEMYIGGRGLARGYWRDEERTAQRFVTHPKSGRRLYRSGDVGRVLPDGTIDILGRADFQVKINGQRIELGEIEAVLRGHGSVKEAVATVRVDPRGEKRLIAHVTAHAEHALDPAELQREARTRLPEHMVPAAIVVLDSLPLTANGKVDRAALPDPALSAPTVSPGPAASDLAARIAGWIAAVLDVESIDIHADFHERGATSVDIVKIANVLDRELGFRPTFEQFFRHSTAAGLAGLVDEQRGDAGGATPTRHRLTHGAARFAPLLDPAEREAFKAREIGLRRDLGELPVTRLEAALPDGVERLLRRSSHRHFADEPIPRADLGRLLAVLRRGADGGHPKYAYASAGGLYPVQTYLHLKPGRVAGMAAGTYYFDPAAHQLIRLDERGVTSAIHAPAINQPTFERAAFSIFFIAQLAAIGPMYGDLSMHFATLEAGLMTALLELAAPECQLGLCQIGDLHFDPVRDLFKLDEGHVLVHSLVGGRLAGAPTDLAGEVTLDPKIRADRPPREAAAPRRVLLTGASGFLGAFLLREILAQTGATVECLVRAATGESGLARIRRSMESFGLWDEHLASRVVAVPGDLSRPLLGLSARKLDELAAEIDRIYHNGADVNFAKPYAALKPANVDGTRSILALAARGPIPVHHVSTTQALSWAARRAAGDRPLDGYAQSKWVAEEIAHLARQRGLQVALYRPGIICGDSRTGAGADDQFVARLIRACVALGSAPASAGSVNMTPVDHVAAAIVHLSHERAPARDFNIANPASVAWATIVEWLRSLGHPIELCPADQWQAEAIRAARQSETSPLFPLVPFLEAVSIDDLFTAPPVDCRTTLEALSDTPIVCPAIDRESFARSFLLRRAPVQADR